MSPMLRSGGGVSRAMKRREFIAGIGVTAAWPLVVRAQQTGGIKRVAILNGNPETPTTRARVAGFQQGLAQAGWREGQDISFEVLWGGADAARIDDYAAELVKLRPNVILATNTPTARSLAAGRLYDDPRRIHVCIGTPSSLIERGAASLVCRRRRARFLWLASPCRDARVRKWSIAAMLRYTRHRTIPVAMLSNWRAPCYVGSQVSSGSTHYLSHDRYRQTRDLVSRGRSYAFCRRGRAVRCSRLIVLVCACGAGDGGSRDGLH